jgi:hypothetical protein
LGAAFCFAGGAGRTSGLAVGLVAVISRRRWRAGRATWRRKVATYASNRHPADAPAGGAECGLVLCPPPRSFCLSQSPFLMIAPETFNHIENIKKRAGHLWRFL